jgi:SAM-dependent methyltransferase
MPFPWSFRRRPDAVPADGERREAPDNRKVAAFWAGQTGKWKIGGARHWTELRQVQEVINRRVSGDPAVDPYLHFLRTRLDGRLPVPAALTIGCGGGDLERGLCQYGFARRHDAIDVAPGSIERAISAAKEAGLDQLRYRVGNGNEIRLEPDSYTVVFGVHSIHHLVELEHVFREVAGALGPNGLFFMNEFVGPTRFQWTDRQLEVVNGLLRTIPEELRASTVDGSVKREVRRPTVEEMLATDPSEAIRSGDIMGAAEAFFEILEVRPYGGTVLQLLLDDIAGNFARPDGGTSRLLESLCEIEWALVESGDLASDFAVVVAKPRSRLPG